MALVKYKGLYVRTKKGSRGLSSGQKARIDVMESRERGEGKRLRYNDSKCTVVFFGAKPIQRCEGRKLRAHNRRQCRGAKKKFVRCKGRRR